MQKSGNAQQLYIAATQKRMEATVREPHKSAIWTDVEIRIRQEFPSGIISLSSNDFAFPIYTGIQLIHLPELMDALSQYSDYTQLKKEYKFKRWEELNGRAFVTSFGRFYDTKLIAFDEAKSKHQTAIAELIQRDSGKLRPVVITGIDPTAGPKSYIEIHGQVIVVSNEGLESDSIRTVNLYDLTQQEPRFGYELGLFRAVKGTDYVDVRSYRGAKVGKARWFSLSSRKELSPDVTRMFNSVKIGKVK